MKALSFLAQIWNKLFLMKKSDTHIKFDKNVSVFWIFLDSGPHLVGQKVHNRSV